MRLRVHSTLTHSHVNGPGIRAVVWLQGCSLRCSRCWNPDTHDRNLGRQARTLDLADWILSLYPSDGLTLSGGEPMEQAPALTELLTHLHSSAPYLSIGLFSGYTEQELEQGGFRADPDIPRTHKQVLWARIRSHLDFAVLGRYRRREPASDPLVTSRNQRLRLYSSRYTLADFGTQAVEISISSDGLTQITGFPVLGSLTENRE